jgi:hypothetical protein
MVIANRGDDATQTRESLDMTYELKEILIDPELPASTILQAKGAVIYREAVVNGGTLQVPVIPQAKAGDTLNVKLMAYGTWSTDLVLDEDNLGLPLNFNVQYRSFSQGDSAVASYSLTRGANRFFSPETIYELKD